jgi:hypothetical protein
MHGMLLQQPALAEPQAVRPAWLSFAAAASDMLPQLTRGQVVMLACALARVGPAAAVAGRIECDGLLGRLRGRVTNMLRVRALGDNSAAACAIVALCSCRVACGAPQCS